jgi:L-fucose isomerase-like protein
LRTNMSHKLRVAYVSFGRPTFDLEQANRLVKSSIEALQVHDVNWTMVENLITDVDTARQTADALCGKVDLLVAQFSTFVDGRFITTMAGVCKVPVLAWAIPELNREYGQRLSLNSLTGANLAGRELHQLGLSFQFLYGDPTDGAFQVRLERSFRFWKAWQRLNRFHVVTLGDAPDGFFFSTPGPIAAEQLGIHIHHLDLHETFQRATTLTDEAVQAEIERVRQSVHGLQRLPTENILKFAKMLTVLRHDLELLGADAVAVRCWPEFFTDFGAAACSIISALSEDGIMGACEADVLGSLSMDVLQQLTESPAYLGDLVELNPADQCVTFWHCGAGAFSLAHPATGAEAGRHPNRNVGFTLEFGLKPGVVTILRVGEDYTGHVRALVGKGEVLDEPQRFRGTSGRVRLLGGGEANVLDRVTKVIEAGFEPHYAIAYGDVADELHRLFTLAGVPVTTF